jgi:hypothetical protein
VEVDAGGAPELRIHNNPDLMALVMDESER